MSGLLARAADLPALMSGAPAILVAETLPGWQSLRRPGLALWRLVTAGDAFRLVPEEARPEEEGWEGLALPPAGALAVILPEKAAAAAALAAWWQAAAGLPPPLIEAADAAAAGAAVAARLLDALQGAQARAVALERSLVQTRRDYEETREVVAALSRRLGHRPPSPLSLALALEPGPGRLRRPAGEARLALRQPLGLRLQGIAALALHLAALPGGEGGETASEPAGAMRLRLRGEESGRIFAAWTLPAGALAPGWLTLDLPCPLGPERESAALELVAEGGLAAGLALSLEEGWVPAHLACAVAGLPPAAEPEARALALRFWTAGPGERFIVPEHWNWDEAGASLPLEGVPQAIAPGTWHAARRVAGQWGRVAIGGEAPRLSARLRGAEEAALLLPRLTLAGHDVLRLDWSLRLGEAEGAGIGLCLLDRDAVVRGPAAALALGCFSGWRDLAAGSLTMTLPLGLGWQAQALILLRGAEGGDLQVELSALSLLPGRAPERLLAARARAEAERAPEPLAEAGVPVVGAVELHQHLRGRPGYEHLDIGLRDLAGGGQHWPGLRFKLARNNDTPLLEFRRARDWPEAFVEWPGRESDRFGPVMRLRPAEVGRLAGALSHPRDAALLAVLLDLLPLIADEAARQAGLGAEAGLWREAAGRFLATLPDALPA